MMNAKKVRNPKIECCECNEKFSKFEICEVGMETYCSECYDDKYEKCDHCDEDIEIEGSEEYYKIDGLCLCETCKIEYDRFECEMKEATRVFYENGTEGYIEVRGVCYGCGIDGKFLTTDENDDEWLCPRCEDGYSEDEEDE
jgi:hypothetical protein